MSKTYYKNLVKRLDSINEIEIKSVDRNFIQNLSNKGTYKDISDEPLGQQTLADLPRDPVFDAKIRSLNKTMDRDPMQYRKIKVELMKKVGRLRMDRHKKNQILNDLDSIIHPNGLIKWYDKNVLGILQELYNDNVLNEHYNMNKFDENKFSFLIKTGLKKSKSRVLKENFDTTAEGEMVQDTDTVSEVSKYLNMESAEDILTEIEKELQKESMERKLNKLKEVISAIDEKANSLEEDANVKEFVNPSKIKEMRRTTKKLRLMQERLTKEYAKKFADKKEKPLNENKINIKMSNNFDLKKFLVENKLTKSSILKEQEEQQELIDSAEELASDPDFQAEIQPKMAQIDALAKKLGITQDSTPEEITAAITNQMEGAVNERYTFRKAGMKGGGYGYIHKANNPDDPEQMERDAESKLTSGIFRVPLVGTALLTAIGNAAASAGATAPYLRYGAAGPEAGLAALGLVAALFAWQVVQYSTRMDKAAQVRQQRGMPPR